MSLFHGSESNDMNMRAPVHLLRQRGKQLFHKSARSKGCRTLVTQAQRRRATTVSDGKPGGLGLGGATVVDHFYE